MKTKVQIKYVVKYHLTERENSLYNSVETGNSGGWNRRGNLLFAVYPL